MPNDYSTDPPIEGAEQVIAHTRTNDEIHIVNRGK